MTSSKEAWATCLCSALRRASRSMSRTYDDALRAAGLRITQLHVLSFLSENPKSYASDVGRALNIEKSTLSRSLAILQKQGLVDIDAGSDARGTSLALSREGKRRLERALPLWQGVQKTIRAELGKDALDAFALVARFGSATE
jgi:DNA-binding MarR family transcriptional regulator